MAWCRLLQKAILIRVPGTMDSISTHIRCKSLNLSSWLLLELFGAENEGRNPNNISECTNTSGPIVSLMTFMDIRNFELSSTSSFESIIIFKFCSSEWWYPSHCPMQFWASMPLNCRYIPISSAVFSIVWKRCKILGLVLWFLRIQCKFLPKH